MRDEHGRFIKGDYQGFGFKKGATPWNKDKHPDCVQGKNHPMWKNGKTIGSDGSVLIKRPDHPFCNKNGYILEHRLVVEAQIGRYLTAEEVVHHDNEIRNDNRPQNLIGFISDSFHRKYHNGKDIPENSIFFDGRTL